LIHFFAGFNASFVSLRGLRPRQVIALTRPSAILSPIRPN
jgi:hypothetical protein